MAGQLTGKARQLEMHGRILSEHHEHEQSNAMRCRGDYMRLEQPHFDSFYSYFFPIVFSGVMGVGICSMDGSSRIARRLEFFCSIIKDYDNISKHNSRSLNFLCMLEK